MIRSTPVTFAVQSSADRDISGGTAERLVNLYADPTGDAIHLRSHHEPLAGGVVLADGHPVRSMELYDGALYAACGGALWRVDEDGAESVGALKDGPTTMAATRDHLAIASGGEYRVYDGETIASTEGGAFDDVETVSVIDGYVLLTERGGDRIQQSRLHDAHDLDPLKFGRAESRGDAILRGIALDRELWLFGARSVEILYNAGGAGFAFQRREELPEVGCLSGQTVAKVRSALYWVGDDRMVYRNSGFQPARVSSSFVERVLHDADPATLTGFEVVQDSRPYYVLRREGDTALVLDTQTGLWSERSSGVDLGEWTATSGIVDGKGRARIGDSAGVVSYLGDGSSANSAYLRLARSRGFRQAGNRFTVAQIDAHIQTGGAKARATDRVDLRLSRDGLTWDTSRARTLGVVGERNKRIRWNGLGRHTEAYFEIATTSPGDFTVFGVNAAVRQ